MNGIVAGFDGTGDLSWKTLIFAQRGTHLHLGVSWSLTLNVPPDTDCVDHI